MRALHGGAMCGSFWLRYRSVSQPYSRIAMTAPVSTCLFRVSETITHLEDCKKRMSGWPSNSRLPKSEFQILSQTSFSLREKINMLTDSQVRKTSPDYTEALGWVPPRKKPRVDDQVDVVDVAVEQAAGGDNAGHGLDDAPAVILQAPQSGNAGESLDNVSAEVASNKPHWGCSVQ